MHKDAEHHVTKAEEMGKQEDVTPMDKTTVLEAEAPSVAIDEWCYMYWVLSLQKDFLMKRPMIQLVIEKAGHVCLFLPWFHCELNLIEMLWGYGKYCALILFISYVPHAYLRSDNSFRILKLC